MQKKRLKKYLFKGLKILLLIFFILFVASFIYISVNKKTIIANITRQVAQKVKGNLTYRDVDITFFKSFPRLSLTFQELLLTDSAYEKHHHPFLKCEKLFLSLHIFKLVAQKNPIKGLAIQNGLIYIYTDSTGYSNDYLMKPQVTKTANSPSSEKKIGLKKVSLEYIEFIKEDLFRKKLFHAIIKQATLKIDGETEKVQFGLKTNMHLNALTFKQKKGAYLAHKNFKTNLNFYYDKATKRLVFKEAEIEINRHQFLIDAWFDLKKDAPQFSLKINTKNILYDSVKLLLTPKIARSLSKVSLTAPITTEALIAGPLKGGEPLVYLTGYTKNSNMATNFMDFSKTNFNFLFTNEVNKNIERADSNSAIIITKMTADWHQFPVQIDSIAILNLEKPLLRAQIKSNFNMSNLNALVGNSILCKNGTGTAHLNYVGPIERNNQTNSFLNGVIQIKDAEILYVPRNIPLKNLKASISFSNSNLSVTQMSTVVFGNLIETKGTAKNLLSLINTSPNKIVLDWEISSASLNLNPFLSLIQPRKRIAKRASAKSTLDEMANKIDVLLEESSVALKFNASKIQYKKFMASQVFADVFLIADQFKINKLHMNQAGGTIDAKALLQDLPNQQNKVNFSAQLHKIDISEIFRTFNNFNQDGIEAQNIRGKLDATVKANFILNSQGAVVPGSTNAQVTYSLKNGALIQYEPIKRLQSFIFKNRDFDHINFAELKSRLEVNGQKIIIHPLQIQSSVLSVYVKGIYTNDDRTDISIRIPLSNLNSRPEDYKPKNKKKNEKIGTSIYLRGRRQNNSDVKFKLDLFKKYDKEH